MEFSELKKTHEEITEKATVGKKGYTIDGDKVKIWNGQNWEDGVFVLDGDTLTHKNTFEAYGII